MNKSDNLIFYSVNSRLASYINQKFYGDIHYVWVAPYFNCEDTNPSSANPRDIYRSVKRDLRKGAIDYHSAYVYNNRNGIMQGAKSMFGSGKIDEKTKNLIFELARSAHHDLFEPLIYIIPSHNVINRVNEPYFFRKANTLSQEYTILDLKRDEFDTIKL